MKYQAKLIRETYRVAEPCAVEIILQFDRKLTQKDCLQFQFPNSWSLVSGPSFTREFQAADGTKEHFVSVRPAADCDAVFELSITKHNLHYPQGAARHGRLVTARLASGTVPAGTPVKIGYENTFAPYIAEEEELWIRVNGFAPVKEPVLKVRADEHKYFRVIAPSFARTGAKIEILLASFDRFDNLSSTVFKGESLSLAGGPVLAENICFTGSLRVPVRLKGSGVRRFRFGDAVSNAVKISTEARGPYWGDLHIHTKLSHDGQGTNPYAYAREASGLDFAAVTDHWESLGEEGYRVIKKWAAGAHEPGVFVTIPADERNPRRMTGHHNIYFLSEKIMERYQAVYVEGAPEQDDKLEDLLKADPNDVIIIPHHTGIHFGDFKPGFPGCAVRWDACDDGGLRPVMEIYSHHGQSELYSPQHLLAYECNRMRNPERRANTSVPGPFYAQDYWTRGKRIGVIASSDEHSGQGGRRHGGIAAVFAGDLTRKSIFEAIRARCCYATTGERILLDFTVGGMPMGSTLDLARGAEAAIRLQVWGTDLLLRIDILRHRFGVDQGFAPAASVFPKPQSTDFSLELSDKVEGPCMYYARVLQQPLDWPGMAWTSPVWIDMKK